MGQSKEQAEFNRKMTNLYNQYLVHCLKEGIVPASPDQFADGVKNRIAGMISEKKASKVEDWSEVVYVAYRKAGNPNPPAFSQVRQCAQCGEDVWVAHKMVNRADKSKMILCNICTPELVNKDMDSIIKKDLEDL